MRLDNFLSAAQEFGVKGLAEDIKELSDTLQHTPHHQAGLQIRIPLCWKIDRLRILSDLKVPYCPPKKGVGWKCHQSIVFA